MPDLYPYQRDAVEFAKSAGGRCILADDMGLGKTVEALKFVEEVDSGDVLIVCPASVLYKWQKEELAWCGQGAELVLTSKEPLVGSMGKSVDIMSYAIMTRRYQELRDRYRTIIFDECHALKNYKAQRTRAAKLIAKNARYILGLSGTPFMNRPIEMFNLLNMLDPKTWPSVRKYGVRYCGGLSADGLYMGATNLDELQKRLRYIMIRRLKSDVLDQLPALTRTHVPVDIPNYKEYKDIKRQVREAIAALDPEHKGYFVNALDRLNLLRRVVGKGKAALAIEFVDDMMGQVGQNAKVVVFAHHKEVVHDIAQGLIQYNPVTFTGEDSAIKREDKVGMFRGPGGPRVMVLTTAGGEGIDLFGSSGVDISRIVMVEREWNPSTESQVESRLHRMGQTSAVNAYYLVARKTIDSKFSDLVEYKRRITGSVFGESIVKNAIAMLMDDDG